MSSYTIEPHQPPPSRAPARLAYYKKWHGGAWRDFVNRRHGWTKYGQRPEQRASDQCNYLLNN